MLCTVIASLARRHVPRTSPSITRAPGHTRGVHSSPRRFGVGHQQRAVLAPEQVVGISAGQQPGRRGRTGVGAEALLVAAQDERLPDRRSHRGQRPAESLEGRRTHPRCDPRPLGERRRRRRPVDVQVSARQLEPGVEWIDLRRRQRPHRRQPCAGPADRDGACPGGVPQRVRIDPERLPRPGRRSSSRRRGAPAAAPPDPPSGAVPWRRPGTGRARTRGGRARRRRTPGTAAPTAGSATGRPRPWAPHPRRERGSRAARPAACCPAARPRRPGAATPARPAAARRAHPPAAGSQGSASWTARAARSWGQRTRSTTGYRVGEMQRRGAIR